jgi:hypothetical protein
LGWLAQAARRSGRTAPRMSGLMVIVLFFSACRRRLR